MTDLERELGFTAEDKARWMQANAHYYDDPEAGWLDKLMMHACPKRSAAVYVMPSYQSPVTNKWIDTPSQRRDDLKRNGSRPWEGMAVEKQEAARRKQYEEQRQDAALTKSVEQAYRDLPDSKKQLIGA